MNLPVNTMSSGHSPDIADDSSAAPVSVAVLERELGTSLFISFIMSYAHAALKPERTVSCS